MKYYKFKNALSLKLPASNFQHEVNRVSNRNEALYLLSKCKCNLANEHSTFKFRKK
jgi:hypothetical protein